MEVENRFGRSRLGCFSLLNGNTETKLGVVAVVQRMDWDQVELNPKVVHAVKRGT